MRKLSIRLIVLACLIYSGNATAQLAPIIDIQLPEILPASPEASGFVKAGYGSSTMSTGAVSVNIPLYTLQVKNLSFPISISYSSQGVKIDESSSRVGYGWNLNAGGLITRTVRDDPDELAFPITRPANLGAPDSANYWWCEAVTQEGNAFDTQADEYTFSFNGYSGKFVFDSAGNAVVTSHNNLKIAVTGSSRETFLITTTDGVVYKFGGAQYEKVRSHNVRFLSNYLNNIKTAFFLYEIVIPGGEKILFNYSSIQTEAATGITDTYKRSMMQSGTNLCLTCPDYSEFTTQTNLVEYDTRYLTGISTSNGLSMSLYYEPRPDESGDKRVTSIVFSTSGTILKNYKFDYYDRPPGNQPGINHIIGRFFLTTLTDRELPDGVTLLDTLDHKHVFQYKDLELTPEAISRKQDHWGFYNANTGGLLPYDQNFPSDANYLNGNRSPDPDYATRGILQSITYPTGGKEEFFYKGNGIYGQVANGIDPATIEIAGNYQGSNTHYSYFSPTFFVPYEQTVTVDMFSIYNGSGTPPSGRIVQFYIKENNDTIYHNYLEGNNYFQTIKTLHPGNAYRLELKILNDYNNAGQFSLQYDTTLNPTFSDITIPTGGVRLHKIKYTSPEKNVPHYKYYTYGTIEQPLRSSGVAGTEQSYSSFANQMFVCPNPFQGYSLCRYGFMSSNTAFNIFNMSGSHIYYMSVIESDDSLFANGGTEYSFFHPDAAATGLTILGESIPGIPMDSYGTLNGQVSRVRQFDKMMTIISDQLTHFDTVYPANKTVRALYVRKKWDVLESPPYYFDEMESFDIAEYYYRDVWYRKRSTVTQTYSSNNETGYDSVAYSYGTADNILPFETISTDSKGRVSTVAVKYPTDYTGVAPLTQMVSKNMIGEPVEVSAYTNDVLQQQKKVSFRNWLSVHDVIRPDTIRVKAATDATVKDALYFERYDSSGNVLQARKADDAPLSYIWDHKKTFPIAQVTGAAYDQVAYTSFEGDGWGNWKPVAGGAIHTHTGFTGSKSYSGTLRDTLTTPGDYVVTLWTPGDTIATVNGSAGDLLRTVRGWKLYQWLLTNPSVMIVVVTGARMDEVRLHPAGAMMNTYTYDPFVGTVAQADAANEVVYYQYDGYHRLKTALDIDSNILQHYRYRYLDTITACTDATAEWVATGHTRCVKNGNNNNTGEQEEEQKDMNYCSPGYRSLRWVSLGTTGSCPPVPDCTGPDKRVVNGVCETGVKVYTTYTKINSTTWECIYHYEFSDGHWTMNYSELNIGGACLIDL